MRHRAAETGTRQPVDDAGLSLLVTVISLLVTALLVLIVLKATATSSTGAASGTPDPVAQAAATQAQQNLANGLTTARAAETSGQEVGPDALNSADPSITFTSSASTGPGTVSVASDGTVLSMAARSGSDTCWELWSSPSAGTWFGTRTGHPSCPAPDPTIGPTSILPTSGVAWQQGSFPRV